MCVFITVPTWLNIIGILGGAIILQNTKINRWTKLARGLGQVGLGLAGGFIAGDVADYYNRY